MTTETNTREPGQNPYVVGRPVNGVGRFFGQQKPLQRLRRTFIESLNPSHLAIVGETRSGKTSLVAEFLRSQRDRLFQRFCLVQFDLSADFARGPTQHFYQQLLENTWDIIHRDPRVTTPMQAEVQMALEGQHWGRVQIALKRAFQRFREAGISLLYVFDEFDCAPTLFTDLDTQAFKLLRLLGEGDHVAFLTLSRRTIMEIEKDAGISSNFAGIFDPTDLNVPLLDLPEAEQLCREPARQSNVEWGDQVVQRLVKLSGGHPYLLQGLCSKLFQDAAGLDAPAQLQALEANAEVIFVRLYNMMTLRLRKTGLDDALVKALKDGIGSVPQESMDRLSRLNYFVKSSQGRLEPFSPLLVIAATGVKPTPESQTETFVLLQSWGFEPGLVNLLVEGETDRDYLQIAAACVMREDPATNLLVGMRIVPGGLGRQGGVKAVARRLVAVKEASPGKSTRVLALLDHDEMGLTIKEALDKLGFQNKKDYLLLDRSYFPITDYNGKVEVEIEDLLSEQIQTQFLQQCPEGKEAVHEITGKGRRITWRGDHKGHMVEFVRQTAQLADVAKLVELLKTIRKMAGLD